LYIGTEGLLGEGTDSADWDLIHDIGTSALEGLAISGSPRHPLMRLLEEKSIPVVGDSHSFPFGVEVDWGGLLREGCRRLHNQGCRRIAVMGWISPGILNLLPSILSDLDLAFRPKWMKHDIEPVRTAAAWALVREIWTAYPEKPDGLLICDDVLFASAVPAILELHIQVPDQLRIVAHANKGSRPEAPFPVTFAEVDPQDMAYRMAAMLLKLARREPVETTHEFSPIHWTGCDSHMASAPRANASFKSNPGSTQRSQKYQEMNPS
jgi:DNA-binding LacI/PurR family transcriptional regulator